MENGHDDIAARQFQNEDRVADSVHKLSTTSAQDLPMLNHGNEDAAVEPAEGLLPVPGAQLGNLDPYRIVANTRQPRSEFDEEALDELTLSIREFGVFQPIVVRPLNSDDPRRGDADYELIMGERRLRATKASGRDSIPAIIRHTDDEDMLRDALLENLHRAELNPLEEASAYQQLLDDFGCSQQELSDRIGRSRPRISNTLRLLKLPVDVQRKVAAGVLSAGHARAVLSVHEPAAMAQLSDKIINENLSVREAELAASTMGIRTEKNPSRQSQVGSDSLNAHLSTVGERLGDRLNTRVKVVLRKTKGQISIDFASVADLNRILEAIGESTEA
ncbi:MAG: ParB/RepB/Spo0J family partition protein [Gulosibacter sp.]|uniref:ParB/RepB/Spo0J family partition protein n=1 Tax=Gulosibacter sp. TaxID=2817531 RepID=UPI003F93344A